MIFPENRFALFPIMLEAGQPPIGNSAVHRPYRFAAIK
jgi:hypothetical protein